MKPLHVLHCASEVAPYSKTGGLGDVTCALPKALRELGCDVRIFTPLYRSVRSSNPALTSLSENLPITLGNRAYSIHLWVTETSHGVPVYFLEKDEFFDRSYIYGTPKRGDYEDNAERFITFCRSVYILCNELNWFPDLFHLHDWQTALVAAYQRFAWHKYPAFSRIKTLFTIHNLGYQGIFPGSVFEISGLPPEAFSIRGMEFWGQCNFIKAGIYFSDWLSTVSPRYSQEIQTPEFGFGLDKDISSRRDRLTGILNGIDTHQWDPLKDPYIPRNFSAGDLSGKRECKAELLKECGFSQDSSHELLVAMIGRLVTQKGFDLIREIYPSLASLPIRLIILGTGDPNYESWLRDQESSYPQKLRAFIRFDESLAHRIEAGADLFLMPSRYEPCGLNQMYSLRYGTIPLVHATGGLDDSVIDILKYPDKGTGFKFYRYRGEDLLRCLTSALKLFDQKKRWYELQKRAMNQDFSWEHSARQYLNLYSKILKTA